MHSFLKFCRFFKLSFSQISSPEEYKIIKNEANRSINAINSGPSFWQFHKNLTQFLFDFTRKHKRRFKPEHYPWRENDVLRGDYERLYHDLFSEYHPMYKKMLNSETGILVENAKLQFQFGRLVDNHEALTTLQRKISSFLNNKSTDKKIFFMLVAVTNHWVGFSAVVIGSETRFYYFDSRNIDCVGMSED